MNEELFRDKNLDQMIISGPKLLDSVNNQISLKPYEAHPDDHSSTAGFRSLPNFLTRLTDLSEAIMSEANKEEALKQGLISINAKLPAAVYLPFTASKTTP